MNPQFYTAISYSDDIGYRAAIRRLFSMSDASLLAVIDDVDPVSLDENQYDAEATNKTLNIIYAKTRDNAKFQEIYICAAGFMFSEDPEIGLAVLFSYDYLAVFHPFLCGVLQDRQDTAESLNALRTKLGIQ